MFLSHAQFTQKTHSPHSSRGKFPHCTTTDQMRESFSTLSRIFITLALCLILVPYPYGWMETLLRTIICLRVSPNFPGDEQKRKKRADERIPSCTHYSDKYYAFLISLHNFMLPPAAVFRELYATLSSSSSVSSLHAYKELRMLVPTLGLFPTVTYLLYCCRRR